MRLKLKKKLKIFYVLRWIKDDKVKDPFQDMLIKDKCG